MMFAKRKLAGSHGRDYVLAQPPPPDSFIRAGHDAADGMHHSAIPHCLERFEAATGAYFADAR